MKHLMTGNEAAARGAYEAGLVVGAAYPGTPSTEIFENLPLYRDDLYCEWSPNEKVATEVAYGASIAGVRSLCAMKHVGVNVAADPIFTATYNGNIFSAVEETVTSCTCRNTCTSELLLTRQAQIFSNSTCSNDYCIGQYLFL